MKRILMVIAAVVAVAGCNTISGIGKDVSAAGSAVDKAAQDTKKKM
jgi:predicted small secreted protein